MKHILSSQLPVTWKAKFKSGVSLVTSQIPLPNFGSMGREAPGMALGPCPQPVPHATSSSQLCSPRQWLSVHM